MEKKVSEDYPFVMTNTVNNVQTNYQTILVNGEPQLMITRTVYGDVEEVI